MSASSDFSTSANREQALATIGEFIQYPMSSSDRLSVVRHLTQILLGLTTNDERVVAFTI